MLGFSKTSGDSDCNSGTRGPSAKSIPLLGVITVGPVPTLPLTLVPALLPMDREMG